MEGENGKTVINFDNAIIAAGSVRFSCRLSRMKIRAYGTPPTLELKSVPKRMLVMGGGIIGLEMGTVYHALGSEIDVVEMFDRVIRLPTKTW